jgi:hypothetical protein
MPRNQETNITRVKRHKTCISFKSHKPWKAQILMKLKKIGILGSLKSWLESSKLKRARRLPQGGEKLKDQIFCIRETSGLKMTIQLKQMVLQHTNVNEHPQTSAAFNFKVLQTFGHPCPSDLNPYAWIDLHYRNQLQIFVYQIMFVYFYIQVWDVVGNVYPSPLFCLLIDAKCITHKMPCILRLFFSTLDPPLLWVGISHSDFNIFKCCKL